MKRTMRDRDANSGPPLFAVTLIVGSRKDLQYAECLALEMCGPIAKEGMWVYDPAAESTLYVDGDELSRSFSSSSPLVAHASGSGPTHQGCTVYRGRPEWGRVAFLPLPDTPEKLQGHHVPWEAMLKCVDNSRTVVYVMREDQFPRKEQVILDMEKLGFPENSVVWVLPTDPGVDLDQGDFVDNGSTVYAYRAFEYPDMRHTKATDRYFKWLISLRVVPPTYLDYLLRLIAPKVSN